MRPGVLGGFLLEDEASAFVASRVCIVQALEATDHEMPRGLHQGLARQMKDATMTTKLVALVLLCLMTGTAMAQQAKVTPCRKILRRIPVRKF